MDVLAWAIIVGACIGLVITTVVVFEGDWVTVAQVWGVIGAMLMGCLVLTWAIHQVST